MITNEINELYNRIYDVINKMIPEEWYKILLYAEIEDGFCKVSFYYYRYVDTSPVYWLNIRKMNTVSVDEFNALRTVLFNDFYLLWQKFVNEKQKVWTNITMEIYSNGKLDVKYDYTKFDEDKADIGQRQLIWEYQNIGIKPTNKYDIEFLKKYLNKEEL